MKKVYLCHEFDGIYDNAKLITDYIKSLITYNKFAIYISPVHLFGMLHNIVDSSLYSEYCISLLKDCDMMITFGDQSKNKECTHQINYCKKHNIPVIEYVDYCKKYTNKSTVKFGVDKNDFYKFGILV